FSRPPSHPDCPSSPTRRSSDLEIAGKRAALFGRAPVIGDIDVAVALLGYDGSSDEQFAELRSRLVHDAAHDYTRRRELVDAVPEDRKSTRLNSSHQIISYAVFC